MDRFVTIFVGGVLTFSSAWLGLVIVPFFKLGAEQPYPDPGGQGPAYPQPTQGRAAAGREVYVNMGCLYCHSQQVRSEHFGNWWDENGRMRTGADIKRGWGTRRNVSRDYLHDRPVLLGTMRTGPDLATIGKRYSPQWQHTHLFNPRAANEWSVMPSFAFLYAREKVLGGPGNKSDRALNREDGGLGRLGREWTLRPGYRYAPTRDEVRELVRGAWPAAFKTDAEPEPSLETVDRLAKLWFTPDDSADRAKVAAVVNAWLTSPEEDFQVIPKADADALVEYLMQLDKNAVELPEAKE